MSNNLLLRKIDYWKHQLLDLGKAKLESALNYLTVQNKIKIIEQKIQVIGG